MAKQTGQFPFTGKFGNVIGYQRNGIHFMRSMPEKVQQTKASIKASLNFGIASSKGKLIRHAFMPHLNVQGDRSRVSRLNQSLIKSGIEGLQGYQFNQHTGLKNFFSKLPVLSENHTLQIPAQTITPIPKATSIIIKIITTKIDFTAKQIISGNSKTITIDPNKPFEGLTFDATIKGKGTLLIALQIMFYQGDCLTLDKRYKAADIIAVVPQPIQPTTTKQGKKLTRTWKPGQRMPAPANSKTKLSVVRLAKAEQLE